MTRIFLCLLALALFLPGGAVAQCWDNFWSQPQQAAFANDLLHGDRDLQMSAVFVVQRLGRSRVSAELRDATIALLEQFLDELDAASSEGMYKEDFALDDIVNMEFFMELANTVVDLEDPRSIPILVRFGNYGYSRIVERGLASFGEDALHAIMDFMDSPAANNSGINSGLHTLTMMVEDGEVNGFSASARAKLGRVARESLQGPRSNGSTLYNGIPLALALNEPDLVQTVTEFSQDSGALAVRGFSQARVDMIRRHAAELLDARMHDGL